MPPRPRFASKKHKNLKKQGEVMNLASKAMRAADSFFTGTPVETIDQLDNLLEKYKTTAIDSPIYQQPLTPKPTPAAMKILEETRIEIEKQNQSIARLVAQQGPATPVNQKQVVDFDLEAIERQLEEMQAADENTKQNNARRQMGNAYGSVDSKDEGSTNRQHDTSIRKIKGKTTGIKGIKGIKGTKGTTSTTKGTTSTTKSTKVYNNKIKYNGNRTTTRRKETPKASPTNAHKNSQRVAQARDNAVSLANRRKATVQREEKKFLKTQAQLLESHQKELQELEQMDRHGYARPQRDDIDDNNSPADFLSNHVHSIAQENTYPIDQLRNTDFHKNNTNNTTSKHTTATPTNTTAQNSMGKKKHTIKHNSRSKEKESLLSSTDIHSRRANKKKSSNSNLAETLWAKEQDVPILFSNTKIDTAKNTTTKKKLTKKKNTNTISATCISTTTATTTTTTLKNNPDHHLAETLWAKEKDSTTKSKPTRKVKKKVSKYAVVSRNPKKTALL